ncbi:MAG: PLDc_N domain-containing protein [Geminicoccaceae bacterium]|nr:MAG: PLDc_N domain-containing protein [Geminicoccaceae bacterium]
MFGLEVGILGLIGLVLVVWALFHVIGSTATPLAKALWTVFIIVVPVLGFLAWLIFGPRAPRRP